MSHPRGTVQPEPADVVGPAQGQPPGCREAGDSHAKADDHVYDFVRTLAEGSYGDVHECIHAVTGQRVAIKRFKAAHLDPQIWRLAMRELRVLQTLPRHPNVVELKRAVCSQSSGRLFFVFELLHGSLLGEMSRHPGGFLPPAPLKRAAWQLLQGLVHCHDHQVVHRDIKPANVLVSDLQDPERGGVGGGAVVKLCDFGFARWLPSAKGARGEGDARRVDMSAYVVTRWYRAPEVIVDDSYGTAVDIWSYGCTLAELASGQPLFPGCSSADQLWRITHCLGPLPSGMAARCRADQRLAVAVASPQERGRTLAQRLRGVSPPLLELISACLSLDPARRPSARDLLRLPYFWDVQRPVQSCVPCHPSPAAAPLAAAVPASSGAQASSVPVQSTATRPPTVNSTCISHPEWHHTGAADAPCNTCADALYGNTSSLSQPAAPLAAPVAAAAAARLLSSTARVDGPEQLQVSERQLSGQDSRTVPSVPARAAITTTTAIISADAADSGANGTGGGPLLRRSVTAVVRRATTTTAAVSGPANDVSVTAPGLSTTELEAVVARRRFASRASRLLASLALGGAEAHRRLSGSFLTRGGSGSGTATANGAVATNTASATGSSSLRGSTHAGHITSPLGRTSVYLSATALRRQQQQQQQQPQLQPQHVNQQQQQQQQPSTANDSDMKADFVPWTSPAASSAALAARGSHNGALLAPDRWTAVAAAAEAGVAELRVVRSSVAGASETMRSAIGAFLDESSRTHGQSEQDPYGNADGTGRGGAADILSAPLYSSELNSVWVDPLAATRATVIGAGPGANGRGDPSVRRGKKPAAPLAAAVALRAAAPPVSVPVPIAPGSAAAAALAPPLSFLRSQWRAKLEGSATSYQNNHLTSANSLATISASQLSVMCSPQGVPSPSALAVKSPRHENGKAGVVAPAPPLPLRRGGASATAAANALPIPVRGARPMTATAGSMSTGGVVLSTNVSLLSSFGGAGGGGGGGAVTDYYRLSMTAPEADPEAEAEAEAELVSTSVVPPPAQTAGSNICKVGARSGSARSSISAAAAAGATASASAALAAARWRCAPPPYTATAPYDSFASPPTEPTASPSAILGSLTRDSMEVRPVRAATLAAGYSSSRRWNTSQAAAPPVSVSVAPDAECSTGRCYITPRNLMLPTARTNSLGGMSTNNNTRVFPGGAKLLSASITGGDGCLADGTEPAERYWAARPSADGGCRRGDSGGGLAGAAASGCVTGLVGAVDEIEEHEVVPRKKRAKVSRRLMGALQALKRQMRNIKARALAVF